jgi:hypothetical protein
MAKQTGRRDVGIVRVAIETRGTFPNGQALMQARILGDDFGITVDDTLGGGSRQCLAEVKALLVERGLTGTIRVQ